MEKERQQNEPLEFKPLSSGLGFHPFANGLPYTPKSGPQSPASPSIDRPEFRNGTGAAAAGAPRFALPPKRPLTLTTVSAASSSVSAVTNRSVTASAQSKPTEPGVETAHADTVPGMGYLLSRTLAYGIDTLFNTLLTFIGLCFAFGGFRYSTLRPILTPEMMILAALGIMVLNWALITAQELLFHTTFGKKVFGLELQGRPAQIILRAVLFVPSTLCFGIGIFWSLFDSKRACWHDRASNLQPAQLAKL